MTTNNAANQSSTGFQSLTSGGVFNGRTFTAGTGISISNGDGTSGNPTISATGGFSPNSNLTLFDDFTGFSKTGTGAPQVGNFAYNGTGFSAVPPPDNSHPGVIGSAAFSSVAAPCLILFDYSPNGTFVLGGGAITLNWIFKIVTLSSGVNEYTLRIGFGDTQNNDQANGCYFVYSDALNSGNWRSTTASASTRTNSNSSTAVTTGWHNAQISIDSSASTVIFTMDGVVLATISTNIPTTAISPIFDLTYINIGTIPAGALLIDLWYLTQTLSVPR